MQPIQMEPFSSSAPFSYLFSFLKGICNQTSLMDFMEAKLIAGKMGENKYVPAANLILFMTLSAKLHRPKRC